MKKRLFDDSEVRFEPLLMPLEAMMRPAEEKRPSGALRLAKASWRPGGDGARRRGQRLKIWTR